MEPMFMATRNPCMRYSGRAILTVGVGLVLLSGCSMNPNYTPDASLTQQNTQAYDAEALAASFNFPQATCGETTGQFSQTWYVVFIDRANPDEIRRQYCNDAIGTVRNETGVPTVQVASFTNYDKALRFAAAVGGEVEVTPSDRIATAQPSPSPNNPQANANASIVGGTAYLTANEPGSTINIRESASVSAPRKGAGRAGDSVQVSEQTQGSDGYTWYRVTLQSGQDGWVRSDFVTRDLANANNPNNPNNPNGGSVTNPAGLQNSANSQNNPTIRPDSSTSNSNSYASADQYSSSSSTNSGNSNSGNSGGVDRNSSASASDTGEYGRNEYDRNEYDRNDYRNDEYDEYDDNADRLDDSESYSSSEEDSAVSESESAVLTATDPRSRINIRDDASTYADVRATGYVGDPVNISDTTEGEDGYTWYFVEFESGDSGWVRGDYIYAE